MGEIIGRLHPLIVHLPIGILVLAFLIELLSRKEKWNYLRPAISFILAIAAISAVLSWFTGWIMPKEGIFVERIVGLHFWFALSMTIITILLYFLEKQRNNNLGKYYFPLFIVNMILLFLTGHFGGSLTHGEDFLTKPRSESMTKKVTDVNTLFVYNDIISPILKKKCYSCHNTTKQKGGLNMSSVESFKKGGDEGLAFIAGKPKSSAILKRIHMPIEEDGHMPPRGKVQLNENEIKLLEWWISEGANFNNSVGDTNQDETIQEILKGYEQTASTLDPSGLELISNNTISKLNGSGISLIPLGDESPFAFASISRDSMLSSNKIKKLSKVKANITELDLSFTNLDDKMLKALSGFKNLQKLKLQGTDISSKGIKHLIKLEHLSHLNLYDTKIDDEAFEHFDKMSSLKELYLWQSKVTKESIKEFRLKKPLMQISHEVDSSIFGDARLKPPIITADKDIFSDTLRITMSLNFKNVNVHYTLDGSEPDSNSTKYEKPFLISETANVKAITKKDGWKTSEAAEKLYSKASHIVASISLNKPPSDNYKAKGGKSLIDFEKATISFVDGKWLGYEGEDMKATLDLSEEKKIQSVIVGSMQNTGSYIFFPKSISVSTSKNGSNFKKVKSISIPIAEGPMEPELKSFLIEFEEQSARFVLVEVFGTLKNPAWHPAPGASNWIFIDELMVN